MSRLHESALGVLSRELGRVRIFTPAMLQRDAPTVLEGVRRHGWPTLGELRGKFIVIFSGKDISSSYVERQYLTIRVVCRRFMRPTNAISKKLANLKAALALHFAYDNFCRIHMTLRLTPAMPAGVTDRVWDLAELLTG